MILIYWCWFWFPTLNKYKYPHPNTDKTDKYSRSHNHPNNNDHIRWILIYKFQYNTNNSRANTAFVVNHSQPLIKIGQIRRDCLRDPAIGYILPLKVITATHCLGVGDAQKILNDSSVWAVSILIVACEIVICDYIECKAHSVWLYLVRNRALDRAAACNSAYLMDGQSNENNDQKIGLWKTHEILIYK